MSSKIIMRVFVALAGVIGLGAAAIAEVVAVPRETRGIAILSGIGGVAVGAGVALWFRRRIAVGSSEGGAYTLKHARTRGTDWWKLALFGAIGSVPFWGSLPPPLLVFLISAGWAFVTASLLIFGPQVVRSQIHDQGLSNHQTR